MVDIEFSTSEDLRDYEKNEETVGELCAIAEDLDVLVSEQKASIATETMTEKAFLLCVNASLTHLGLESVSSTDNAWETVIEVLKKTWEAIKRAVKEAYVILRRAFNSLFLGFGKIKGEVADLRSLIRELENDNDAGLVRVSRPTLLTFKDKVTITGIDNGMRGIVDCGKSIYGEYLSAVKDYYKDFDTYVTVLKRSDLENLDKAAMAVESVKTLDTLAGTKTMLATRMLGDRRFQKSEAAIKKTQKEQRKLRGTLELPTPPLLGDASMDENRIRTLEFPALTRQEMSAILYQIEEIADISLKVRRDIDSVLGSRDSAAKAMDSALAGAQRADDIDGEDAAAMKRYINSGMKVVQKGLMGPVTQYTRHSFSVCRNLLMLVERSIEARQ